MDGAQLIMASVIGGMIGFACGLMAFRAAAERKQHGLGIAAMVVCVLVGFVGGCVLALPTAFVFKWIVTSLGEAPTPFAEADPYNREYRTESRRGPDRRNNDDFVPSAPYTVLGTAVVCNRCKKACSKVDGQPPKACPSCDRSFGASTSETPKPWKRAKRAPVEASDGDLVPLERA